MKINTDCTILHDNSIVYIPACMWQEVKAESISRYGAESACSVNVYIPVMSVAVSVNDWIAKGNYNAADDVTTNGYRVLTVDRKDYSASLKHIKVTA